MLSTDKSQVPKIPRGSGIGFNAARVTPTAWLNWQSTCTHSGGQKLHKHAQTYVNTKGQHTLGNLYLA